MDKNNQKEKVELRQYKQRLAQLLRTLKSEAGSATVEFVALAIPLFIPVSFISIISLRSALMKRLRVPWLVKFCVYM